MLRFGSLFVAASLISSSSAAQVPGDSSLLVALQACQRLVDGAARLACYDRAGPALTAATTKGDVALIDRGQVRKARRSLFGFSVPAFPFLSSRDGKNDEESKKIVSTVVSSSPVGYGRHQIVIEEGGAIWQTSEASSAMSDPRKGDKVTIESGSLGSYYLRIGSRR